MVCKAATPSPGLAADGWITHPGTLPSPVVLHFRRVLPLERVPRSLPVTVTADNRFVLYVNGIRAASGPSTASHASWRYSKLDLASYLKPGDNVIAAAVWNFGEAAPLAQISVATGFRMTGGGVATGETGWRVAIDAGRTAVIGPPGRNRVATPARTHMPGARIPRRTCWDWWPGSGPPPRGTRA